MACIHGVWRPVEIDPLAKIFEILEQTAWGDVRLLNGPSISDELNR
jgi:hypothetical protein